MGSHARLLLPLVDFADGEFGQVVVVEVNFAGGALKDQLLALPTIEAIEFLKLEPEDTNAILHVTC